MLIYGELPGAGQLERWTHEVTTRNFVHENVKNFLQGFRYDAHPMAMLAASVGALSSFYRDAGEVHDQQARQRQVVRLLAKMPTLAAFSYRHLLGQPFVYPEDDLTYTGNLLSMMFRMSELKYQPDPRLERALDVLLMLHADHEQNASTTAVRAVGSTHVNPYSAVAAGVEGREISPLVMIARELERRALEDEFFTSRRLYPNVDLYSGLTYQAIGVPAAMFPVMFALARTAGWIAQWLEMVRDPEQQTVRPRQIYTGELDRDYLPIDERD